MTPLTKPVHRVTTGELDGSFGSDRNKRIVVTLIPGDGKLIKDLIGLRPHGTRRMERVAVMDIYRMAIHMRANCENLRIARERKAKKALRLASERQAREEKRLLRPIK